MPSPHDRRPDSDPDDRPGRTASPAHRHRLRDPGLGALGLLLALVVAVVACEIAEWPFLRHPLERKLSQALARPVAFGPHFGIRFLGSVRGHTDAMVIGPPANGGPTLVDGSGHPRDFMRADSLKLALSYGAIYRAWRGVGPIQIRLLDVDGLELNLKRDADGQANWQFGAARPAAAASAPQLPRFERLNVRNGEVRVEDVPLQIVADALITTHEGSAGAAAAGASGVSAAARLPAVRIAANASGPTGVTLATPGAPVASRAASGAASASIDDDPPGLRIDGTGSYRKAPLAIALRSSGLLPLAASDTGTPAVPLWLDVRAGKTRIRLDGSATDLFHFGGMDAQFQASGPSLAAVGDALGVTLPTTAAFTTRGRLRKNGAVWQAGVAAMNIGSSRLRGDFRFDIAPAVPVLSGTLGGARLALADLGPAFGAPAPGAPSPQKPGRVLPGREFDIPSLKAMNADVGVALDTLDLGTDKLEPFKPLQARITLQDGVLDLHDILARTSAGQVQGAIGLDSRPAPPKWSADLRWSGIQLARFVKTRDMAAKKDAHGVRENTGYVSGELAGDAQLAGTGKSTAALLASLDGTAQVWIQDGQVSHLLVEAAGIDVADALGLYIKGDDKVPMLCAIGKLQIAKGRVMPEVAVIDTRESTLLIGGDLSLADESLDLTLTAHPHNFSPLAPRHFSPVAPRTPVNVDGTFSNPHIHLDAKPLLVRGAAAVGLGLINPLAALLALIDLRQPERDVCTTAVAHLTGPAARAGASQGAASSPDAGSAPAHGPRTPVPASAVKTTR